MLCFGMYVNNFSGAFSAIGSSYSQLVHKRAVVYARVSPAGTLFELFQLRVLQRSIQPISLTHLR